MAGDILVHDISSFGIDSILDAGGVLEEKIFHADIMSPPNFIAKACSSRGAPAHIYIKLSTAKCLQKNITAKVMQHLLNSSYPGKNKDLSGWETKSGDQRATALWSAMVNGDITLEIYKIDRIPISHISEKSILDKPNAGYWANKVLNYDRIIQNVRT